VAYLANNNEPGIILKKDVFDVSEAEFKEKDWQSAYDDAGKMEISNPAPGNLGQGVAEFGQVQFPY
jgi:hypothetical protein